MAESPGKSTEDRDIDRNPGADPQDPSAPGDAPVHEGDSDRITRREAKEANRDNPNAPKGPLTKGGWKGEGG